MIGARRRNLPGNITPVLRQNMPVGPWSFTPSSVHQPALTPAFFRREHRVIIPFTVQEILDEQLARKLA